MTQMDRFCAQKAKCKGSVQTIDNFKCWSSEGISYNEFFSSFPEVELQFKSDDILNPVQSFKWYSKYYLAEQYKDIFCLSVLPYQM